MNPLTCDWVKNVSKKVAWTVLNYAYQLVPEIPNRGVTVPKNLTVSLTRVEYQIVSGLESITHSASFQTTACADKIVTPLFNSFDHHLKTNYPEGIIEKIQPARDINH